MEIRSFVADELGHSSHMLLVPEAGIAVVSGARELRAEAGADIGAALEYPYKPLRNSQDLRIGPYRLRVVATPGHTPEHVSYLLLDESGHPLTLFSGGSLMVGTAARPDLLVPLNSWRLARLLRQASGTRS